MEQATPIIGLTFIKNVLRLFPGFHLVALASFAVLPVGAQTSLDSSPAVGLSITTAPDGTRLRCAFQRLEGQVTREGLWLRSTVDNSSNERLRVVAVGVGRQGAAAAAHSESGVALRFPPQSKALPVQGAVLVYDQTVRFIRDGLTEEYSVRVDGVRQDFIIEQRPAGEGGLRVELEVTGAQAEPLVNAVRLVMDGSGRKLAYGRLKVLDAEGRTLTARLEVTSNTRLTVLVDDAEAVYPVQIDPTYTDADWVNAGDILWSPNNSEGVVFAMVADSFGNLYVGGGFNLPGGISATNVAKWNGTTWSALGAGLGSGGTIIRAMAVSDSDLYAGGNFITAGGFPANNVAKWDGMAWSPLGAGVNGDVRALAVLDGDVYVGGAFTMAGDIAATNIAKWNGSTWSVLGTGLNGPVQALAVAGSNLYVGGYFTMAGGSNATRVAKWNGSAWSALGTGLNNEVYALAVSGSNLYVGGFFTIAGGGSANRVAKWNGSTWSALGNGVQFGVFGHPYVAALAVSGSDLYAGGAFQKAGESAARRVAKWDGNAWSPLGSGVGSQYGESSLLYIVALAVSGSDLYVGGIFNVAGGKTAHNFARAIGPSVFTSMVSDPSTNQALITFASSPGASLHLLSSTNLTAWQTNATVTATNVTNSVSVNLTQPQEFFRLQRLP